MGENPIPLRGYEKKRRRPFEKGLYNKIKKESHHDVDERKGEGSLFV